VEVLEKCRREELRLAEEYRKIAEKTSHEIARAFYTHQSAECEKHCSILGKVLSLLGEVPKEPVTEEVPPLRIEVAEIGVRELYSTLKEHLEVEKNAKETYMRLAERASDQEVKNLLLGLVSDEELHHKLIAQLIKDLEQEYGSILREATNSPRR
jgi:rubrerythrin